MQVKRLLRSSLAVIAAASILISGNVISNGFDITANAASSSVYDFNYGSGITWSASDALPTFSEPADTLDVIDVTNMSDAMKYTMMSLQGIVNRSKPRIIISNGDRTRNSWFDNLLADHTLNTMSNYFDIINKYRSYIKGLVVYNSSSEYEDSINVAMSVAGVEDCVVVSSQYVSFFSDKYYVSDPISVKVNLYGKFGGSRESAYTWLYNNYYKNGKLNKRMIVTLSPKSHTTHFGDFAVATKSAVLWLEPNNASEKKVLDLFFDSATAGVTYNMGWWPQEDSGIVYATSKGVSTIPSDFFENITVYMGQSKSLTIPEIPEKPKLENKMYVALALSDGDNTQYDQGVMKDLWQQRRRASKDVPINWTVSPSLYYVAPQMLNYYNTTVFGDDMLISGPSGLGYTKSTRWRQKSGFLTQYASDTNAVFEKTGLNIITIWDRISEGTYSQFAKLMPSLLGVTINNNQFNDSDVTNPDSMYRYGYINWPGETTVQYRSYTPIYGLGAKSGYVRSVADGKSDLMGKLANYSAKEPKFIFKQFVAWDVSANDLVNMAEELKEIYGDKIEFVRADHFFMLLNEANNMPYNLALQSKGTSASSTQSGYTTQDAADGSISTGWQAGADDQQSYYQIDLGERCEISKYTLKNAQAGGMSAAYNTKAYRFQYSLNGSDWVTADTVTNNSKSIIYKTFSNTIAARYFRIVFDDAGTDGVARIQDFEICGTKLGITDDNAPVTVTKIALNSSKSTINMGTGLTISSKVSPMNAQNKSITFKSSNPSALTVSQSGYAKAVKVNTPTKVTVTASANDGSGKSASLTFTVRTGKVEKITVKKKKRTLKIGGKFTVNAAVSPTTAKNRSVKYTSSNKKVATVTQKGVVKAKSPGIAKITVKAKDGSGIKAVITVTVKPKQVTKVKAKKTGTTAAISCKKQKNITKYVFYAKKGSGKWKKVAASRNNRVTVNKLSSKAAYSFRVRALKVSGAKKIYGKYSKTIKIK